MFRLRGLVTTFAFYSLRKILNFIFARSFLFLENLLGFLDCSLRSRKNNSTSFRASSRNPLTSGNPLIKNNSEEMFRQAQHDE